MNLPGEMADYVAPWQRDVQRRAVVPVWLRDKAEAKTAARWAASYAGASRRVPRDAGSSVRRDAAGPFARAVLPA